MKSLVNAFFLTASLATVSVLHAAVAAAEDPVLPAAIIFATSTGYWEDNGDLPQVEHAPAAPQGAEPAAKALPHHGYYKLFAVRQADRTSKVYLQQVAITEDGLQPLSTVELHEIGALKSYVTDIRPENSGGLMKEPGLFATVLLKKDPNEDPERWTVVIDEFGDITVEKSSN